MEVLLRCEVPLEINPRSKVIEQQQIKPSTVRKHGETGLWARRKESKGRTKGKDSGGGDTNRVLISIQPRRQR